MEGVVNPAEKQKQFWLKHKYVPDTFAPVRILTVINDEDTRSRASARLGSRGFAAKSVAEAVRLLMKEEEEQANPSPLPPVFNWIIADVESGLELVKTTKEEKELRTVRTMILVETYDDEDLISRVYAGGACGLMTKEYFID